MSSANRHLRGATNEIKVRIHGKTVVEKNEWIFIARDAVCIVGSTADFYGYPSSKLAGATSAYFDQNLAGISMKGSISGTTEDIPVATSGIFRFQINLGTSATSQAAKVGMTVAAATIGASGTSVAGTTCTVGVGGNHQDCIVGRCVKREPGATSVDFALMSRMAGTSVIMA